ncbi:MAG: hypothetical protein BGO91_10240 [Leifsonia sp. 71-9]|nr:MAG: hypothetical protein BGO91_10240 [Leifsonia sp. 71-9]
MDVPSTYAGPVPAGLTTAEFVLRPITAADAANDHAALMDTRDDLRLWEQSSWPADDFTVEANREDLQSLEARHAAGRAFTYTVVAPGTGECLGCVYLFPPDATFLTKATITPVGADAWTDLDLVVYFWTRRTRTRPGLDERLLAALRAWLADEWRVDRFVVVTNEQFARQAELLRGSDLRQRFELVEPGKPGTYLVFG